MSDYIKREDAIKAFDPKQRRDWYTPWIVETLKDVPSADVAPVRHGRWIDMNTPTENYCPRYKCSVCGHGSDFSNFCPNCGAKMDGDSNE